MDPQAAWEAFAYHMENKEFDEALENAESLARWLAKGGFSPCLTGNRKFDRFVVTTAIVFFVDWLEQVLQTQGTETL